MSPNPRRLVTMNVDRDIASPPRSARNLRNRTHAIEVAKSCTLLHPKPPLKRPDAAQSREVAPSCTPGPRPSLSSPLLHCSTFSPKGRPPLKRPDAAQSREVAENCTPSGRGTANPRSARRLGKRGLNQSTADLAPMLTEVPADQTPGSSNHALTRPGFRSDPRNRLHAPRRATTIRWAIEQGNPKWGCRCDTTGET